MFDKKQPTAWLQNPSHLLKCLGLKDHKKETGVEYAAQLVSLPEPLHTRPKAYADDKTWLGHKSLETTELYLSDTKHIGSEMQANIAIRPGAIEVTQHPWRSDSSPGREAKGRRELEGQSRAP